jgi:hypothetical protein
MRPEIGLMKKIVIGLAILAGVAAAPDGARAEIGTADVTPAATLLLPYFEVDLGNPNGITTLLSVNNASASAAVANVVLWTDWGVPSFGFNLYLTGYDVQTIDLRAIFAGTLPVTADDGADPIDSFNSPDGISNQGALSQDINFPGSTGPCGFAGTLYDAPDPTLAIKVQNINRVHTGLSSPLNGLCWGAPHGDSIARGYVTIDTVTQCTLDTPATAGYFAGVVDYRNILWGDYIYVNPGENFAQGETLVHVEACIPGNGFSGFTGNGAGNCPFVAGNYTFYGRYVAANGSDQREPLATTFAARYQGSNKTDLLVWRDTKRTPTGTNGQRACGSSPAWFPLATSDVVAFDNTENSADVCALASNASPAATSSCFPLATQRVNVKNGNALSAKIKSPYTAGWLFLNLNHAVSSDPFPDVAQAWVSTVRTSEGRFSTGGSALQLDNALTAPAGGEVLLP